MRAKKLALATIMALVAPVVSAQVDIPVVPAGVMKDNVPKHIDAKPKADDTNRFYGLTKINENSIHVMEPGVNEIVHIALHHANSLQIGRQHVSNTNTNGQIVFRP